MHPSILIDEIDEAKLHIEIDRRIRLRESGRCDYCGAIYSRKPVCKFPDRHTAARVFELENGWRVVDHAFELHDGEAMIYIEARPNHCDRGHYIAKIGSGLPDIDAADGFPRYYMQLHRAFAELREWLTWRLYKKRIRVP